MGEAFIVAVAARAAVPARLHEAMAVEGASAWSTTTRMTLPLMAPVLLVLAVRDVVVVSQNTFLPTLTLLLLTGLAAALPLWLAARLAARQRTRS